MADTRAMTAPALSSASAAVVAALLMTVSAFAQTLGVPRTPWGDPDLQGTFTNKDEVGTPLERPREFEGRRVEDFPPAEVAAILKKRDEDRPRVQADASGRIGPTEWQSSERARRSVHPQCAAPRRASANSGRPESACFQNSRKRRYSCRAASLWPCCSRSRASSRT